MIKMFDTHAHYNDEIYNDDRKKVFSDMYANGVTHVTLIGASLKDSKSEKEIVNKYKSISNIPTLYYTIGDHPDEIPKFTPYSVEGVSYLNELELLCKDESGKVDAIAIGEIGMDYHGDFKTEEDFKNQERWFIAEIELAKKLNLPIVIHSRDACQITYDIVKQHASGVGGIVHCFSYEKEIAKEYIKLGFHIGIGGTVTFKNGRKVKEVVENIPIESIVTETDAPWLAPTPFRGKRNQSAYISYVIEEIARLKNMDIEKAADILYNNAFNVYKIIRGKNESREI